jgi:hypothetical protein
VRTARALALAALTLPALAAADGPALDFGLSVQPDLRFRLEDKSAGAGFWDRLTLPAGIERASTLVRARLKAKSGGLALVGQAEVLAEGMTGNIEGLRDFSDVEATQRLQVQLQSLYVEAKGLLIDGLDVRLGQQVVSWGVGDQFNPTNNLNADDLRDPLLFGRQAGNFMLAADYWAPGDVQLGAVLVPIFRPAILPFSAPLGFALLDRVPFTDEKLRWRAESEKAAGAGVGYPTALGQVTTDLPDLALANVQVGARVATTLAEQDVALVYYRGRTHFPQASANHVQQRTAPACNPADASDCIMGTLTTDVTLAYPRMQSLGLNASGEVLGFGYRVEGAVIFPERADITLSSDTVVLGGTTQPAGEYDYDNDGKPGGPRPAVVDSTAFAKWAVGIDHAVGDHLYLNGQWVHGLVDEYGTGESVRASGVTSSTALTLLGCALPRDGTTCASEELRPRVGDYLVVGADLKLMNEALLLRLFSIVDLSGSTSSFYDDNRATRVRVGHSFLSPEGFSALAYPELRYRLESGYELSVGALLLFGRPTSKFGDPAAGGSLAWVRMTGSF